MTAQQKAIIRMSGGDLADACEDEALNYWLVLRPSLQFEVETDY